MSIRAMFCFDDLPKGLWSGGPSGGLLAGCGLEVSGYKLETNGAYASNPPYIDEDGWLSKPLGGNTAFVNLILGNYTSVNAEKFIMGMRYKLPPFLASSGTVLLILATTVSGGNGVNVFTYADLADREPGNEYYLEFSIRKDPDANRLIIERRVNGKPIADIYATVTAHVNLWATRGTYIRWPLRYSNTEVASFKDMYIADSLADEPGDAVSFLGPVRAVPIYLSGATGNDWTTSSGEDLLTVFNADYEYGATPDVPYAQNATTEQPVATDLSVDFDSELTVHGVELFYSGKNSQASNARVEASIAYSGQNQQLGDIALQPNMQYGVSLGVNEKTPTGDTWSKDAINATDFILLPRTVT